MDINREINVVKTDNSCKDKKIKDVDKLCIKVIKF